MSYQTEIAAFLPQNEQEAADQALILDCIAAFPDTILTRENRFAHLTSSALVLSPDGREVLLAHHDIYKVWAWTGGHADGEADLLSVALREAREETGAAHARPLSPAIASVEILPVWGHVKRGQYVSGHLHLNVSYLLTADRDSALRHRPGENSKVAWFPVERMLDYTREPEMDPTYSKLLLRSKAFF